MRSNRDIIVAWGEQQMADDLGVTYSLIHNWKNRNAIPYQYFPAIITRAPLRGIPGVTYELLFSLQRGPIEAGKSTRSKKNASAKERTAV